MRTIWQRRLPVFGSIFYILHSRLLPRSRFMAELGYHVALWLFLGFIYTLSAVYQIRWETPHRTDPAFAQPAMIFFPMNQTTGGKKALGRESRERRPLGDLTNS